MIKNDNLKYTKNVFISIASVLNVIQREVGPIGKEKLMNMLDAFDPELKTEIIMFYMLEDVTKTSLSVRPKIGTVRYNRKLIEAIKAVRSISGYGLKEAKDFIEKVETDVGVWVTLNISNVNIEDYNTNYQKFVKDMNNAGYEIA
jgi:hypothetical protein